jgi:cytochrome P450
MGWAIWCLAHHTECQQKVIDEVDRVFGIAVPLIFTLHFQATRTATAQQKT